MASEVFNVFERSQLIENICREAAAGATYKAPFLEPARDYDEAADRVREAAGTLLGYEWFGDAADDLLVLLGHLNDPDLRQWMTTEARHAAEVRKRFSMAPKTTGGIPPTEKQVKFLVRLGVRDFSGSKSEASALIDRLLKERG